MEKIIWRPEFIVGHHELDSLHEKIVNICNQIADCEDSKDSSRLHELLNEYVGINTSHMELEERILKGVGYPELEEHKAEHYQHQEELASLIFDACSNKINFSILHTFVFDWFKKHIEKTIVKYKPYLRKKPL